MSASAQVMAIVLAELKCGVSGPSAAMERSFAKDVRAIVVVYGLFDLVA